MRRFWLVLALLAFGGCTQEAPIKLGFVGGVSGRVADLGIGGRNGVTLAVEQQNLDGGIQGRPLQLLVEDDHQDRDKAGQAFERLRQQQVAAIIGPMTSAMAEVLVPLANEQQLLLMGVTVTANTLADIDDQFFSTVAPTRIHAGRNAEYAINRLGISRVAIVYDLRNRAFSESWLKDFRHQLEALGGSVSREVGFTSSHETDFAAIANQLLDTSPQAVVLIANSLDAALLAKQLRTQMPGLPLISSEWGGTERLVELGGRHVEGLIVGQFFDRDSSDPYYRAFQERYQARFGHPPGFAATVGYNAARVVIEGLQQQRPDEALKQTLLRIGTFQGLQAPVHFNRFGNTITRTYMTQIRDGRFVTLE